MDENEVSSLVIRDALKIHRLFGPGLLESVYETCLCHELTKSGLIVERQIPIPLVYDNLKLECGFRCDILVNKKLIVECKSVEALNDIHIAQLLSYLKLTGVKLGLLMNFNTALLKNGIKRIVNKL